MKKIKKFLWFLFLICNPAYSTDLDSEKSEILKSYKKGIQLIESIGDELYNEEFKPNQNVIRALQKTAIEAEITIFEEKLESIKTSIKKISDIISEWDKKDCAHFFKQHDMDESTEIWPWTEKAQTIKQALKNLQEKTQTHISKKKKMLEEVLY